jgi:hypothetical protein
MSQAALVRSWAKENGYDVKVRGIIAPAIWQAYADAHGATLQKVRPERGCIARCSCGREWGGFRECHCTQCHRHFSVVQNFDWHEPGRCLDPLTVTDKKGAPRMKLTESVWGPIYIGAGTHFMAESD